ncbi:MAG: hypothetical protein MZU91_03300 [Desulfosudis oleivorans]|nr:hypothetical protein [Desulfosudis oleivorans]
MLLAAYSDDLRQVSAHLVKKVVGGMEKTYVEHTPQVPAHHIRKERTRGLWMAGGSGRPVPRHRIGGGLSDPVTGRPQPDGSFPVGVRRKDGFLAAPPPRRQDSDAAEAIVERQDMPRVAIQDQVAGSIQHKAPCWREADEVEGGITVPWPGDTVARLAARHYGRVDARILDLVGKANREVWGTSTRYMRDRRSTCPPWRMPPGSCSRSAWRPITPSTRRPRFFWILRKGLPGAGVLCPSYQVNLAIRN